MTREELDRLEDSIRALQAWVGPGSRERDDILAVCVLLRAYPSPAEGERAELAAAVDFEADLYEAQTQLLVERGFAEERGDAPERARKLRRAAALLLQPARGVNREAVESVIGDALAKVAPGDISRRLQLLSLDEAISTLPEAE